LVGITASRIENVRGVADPFEHYPVIGGTYNRCEENAANTACLLDWRQLPDDGDSSDDDGDCALLKHGRPYLYFIDPDAETNVTGCTGAPCILSPGPNGHYDWGAGDDIVLNIE
jgi:hypothetical protein